LNTGLGLERVVPGGIPPDKVTTLFGESGNFKTTVKNNLVWNLAEQGHTVLDVSLEDADDLTTHRFIARGTGISYGKIATGDLTDRERESIAAFNSSTGEKVVMAGDIPPNIDEVIRLARYYKRSLSLRAVVLDYIQLLDGGNERETLNEILRKAQLAAKRDKIAYIFVSQVKQDVDTRDDHRPRITDMLGSSALRTASKLSVGVYRPALYKPTPSKTSLYYNLFTNHPQGAELYAQLLELHLIKNVLGEAHVQVHCRVQPETGLLEPFDMRKYI